MSGCWPLKSQVTASTSTGNVGSPRRRQVSRTERIRCTQRSPFSLWVPCISLRQSTATRSARSARLEAWEAHNESSCPPVPEAHVAELARELLQQGLRLLQVGG